MRVSHSTLKALAAAVWLIGAGVLLYKGSAYLVAAGRSGLVAGAIAGAAVGVGIGLLRGRAMFLPACRRNLRRIDRLDRPRLWQFFRPGFFAALTLMLAAGAGLSWLAGLDPWAGLVVGTLELVIALALLTSSVAFWRGDAAIPVTGSVPPGSHDAA